MTRKVFLLVILVSCAHAMVHVYELSLGSVEVELTENFEPNKEKAKQLSGTLGMAWRITFGVGAFVRWLASRPFWLKADVDYLSARLLCDLCLSIVGAEYWCDIWCDVYYG